MVILKFLFRFFYLFRKTSLKGFRFSPQQDVVWVYIFSRRFFFSDELVNTCAIIDSLSKEGVRFNILFGRKIGKCNSKKVYFTYSRFYDAYSFTGYPHTIKYICDQLERQGCLVFPSSFEVEFWENKAFMHEQFDRLKISSPRTWMYKSLTELHSAQIPFPSLVKEEHSCSSYGVHKVQSREELQKLVDKSYLDRNEMIIVQELLNMRRDLRVILVGDKIVLHYWRINRSKDWKPTSTSHGSDVDFVSFPEQWREFIVDQFRALGLRTGAFDIAWQNDDLSTTPLILEVSPYYQPNPAVDLTGTGLTYGQYKERFLFRNGYDTNFVDVVFRITQEKVRLTLERNRALSRQ